MNRPLLLLSRYLSCISCINHVYIYIYFDRFWPSHIILYITIPVVQYIFLSRLCYVYARDILYRLFTVIIIIIIAIQILYLGPVVVNHISIGGGNRYERERETEFSIRANETDPDGVSLRTRYTVKSCWRNSIGQTILEISAEFSTSLSCFFRPIFSFHARFDNWSARYRPYTSDGK